MEETSNAIESKNKMTGEFLRFLPGDEKHLRYLEAGVVPYRKGIQVYHTMQNDAPGIDSDDDENEDVFPDLMERDESEFEIC